ncbi:MAG: Hpt domain-containing protein [Filimonas sp.]|nr:Hpt domain-containing protein [Filimonas sp.]
MDTQHIYDLSFLKEIAKGNMDFIKSLCHVFMTDAPATIQIIRNAYTVNDLDTVGKMAHKMKSTIDSMGMVSIKETIRTLEKNAKQQENIEMIPRLIDQVDATIQEAIMQLKKEYNL